MATEAIGGVSVIIGGDYSKLAADFGNAQNLARAAGQATATAFGSGSGLVDQFGRSVASVGTAASGAAGGVGNLGQALTGEANAAALAAAQTTALGNSLRTIGQHGQSAGFSIRYAFLGIKDVAEGRYTFAFAELANELVRMGPAALAAGAGIAVLGFAGFELGKMAGLWGGISEAEKKANEQAKQYDEQIKAINEHIAQTGREIDSLAFGKAFGQGSEIQKASSDVATLRAQAALFQEQIDQRRRAVNEKEFARSNPDLAGAGIPANIPDNTHAQNQDKDLTELRHLLAVVQTQIEKAQQDQRKGALQILTDSHDIYEKQLADAGQLAAARIQNEEHANARATEIAKARIAGTTALELDAAKQYAAGLDSEYERVIVLQSAEMAAAAQRKSDADGFAMGTRDTSISDIGRRFNAEAQGKTPDEVTKLQVTAQGEIQAARDAYTKATVDSQNTVDAAVQKGSLAVIELNQKVAQSLKSLTSEGWDQMTAAAKRAAEAGNANAAKDALEKAAVLEVNARTAGVTAAANDQIKAAQLKAGYEAQSSHTLAEELAYMQQMADLEDKRYADQIKGLEAEREIAKALDDEEDRSRKVAQIEEQIARLKGQRGAAAFEAQGKQSTVTAQQSLGAKLGADGQAGVANLSQSLAKGIMDGGKGLGKDIRQSLSNIGKQMLGDVIEKGVESMVIAITGNTIATNLNTVATHALEIIETVKTFLGFADGTDSAPGGWSWVGEKGPELMNIPRGAQIVPNHKLPGYVDGVGLAAAGGGHSYNFGDIHLHGVQNVHQMMREISAVAKNTTGKSTQYGPRR